MRVLVALLIALALSNTGADAADASCVPADLSERVRSADVIVQGTVVRAREPGFYEVAVASALKGTVSGMIAVRGSAAPGAVSSVDLRLAPGTTYTLFLRRDLDAFTTTSCSGSHEGAPTAEELAAFGTPSSGTTDASLPLPIIVGLVAGASMFTFIVASLRTPRWSRA